MVRRSRIAKPTAPEPGSRTWRQLVAGLLVPETASACSRPEWRVEPIDDRRAPADQRAEALRDAEAHHGGLEPLGEEPPDAGEGARLLEAGALTLQQAGVVLLEPAQPGDERVGVGRAPAVQRVGAIPWRAMEEQGAGHRVSG